MSMSDRTLSLDSAISERNRNPTMGVRTMNAMILKTMSVRASDFHDERKSRMISARTARGLVNRGYGTRSPVAGAPWPRNLANGVKSSSANSIYKLACGAVRAELLFDNSKFGCRSIAARTREMSQSVRKCPEMPQRVRSDGANPPQPYSSVHKRLTPSMQRLSPGPFDHALFDLQLIALLDPIDPPSRIHRMRSLTASILWSCVALMIVTPLLLVQLRAAAR